MDLKNRFDVLTNEDMGDYKDSDLVSIYILLIFKYKKNFGFGLRGNSAQNSKTAKKKSVQRKLTVKTRFR